MFLYSSSLPSVFHYYKIKRSFIEITSLSTRVAHVKDHFTISKVCETIPSKKPNDEVLEDEEFIEEEEKEHAKLLSPESIHME